MNITINIETIDSIKQVIAENQDKPNYVRVFLAGMGCSGPSLGLTLDETKEGDLSFEKEDLQFVMEKSLHEKLGDISIDASPRGYIIQPVNQAESACGSCSGSCG